MPKAPTVRVRKKKAAPKQVQVNHRWSYVVFWYEEIRRHTPAGFGIGPIEFEAIRAYRDLFQIDMEPFEVELLMKLDLVWRDSLPKEKPRSEK